MATSASRSRLRRGRSSTDSRYRTIDAYLYETATRVAQLSKDAALGAMEESLASVGLAYKDVRGKYPNQFSGGELHGESAPRLAFLRNILEQGPVAGLEPIDGVLRMF